MSKSYYKLQKENSELRKELKFYKDWYQNRTKNIKQISIKNSYNYFYNSREWKEIRYKVLMKHKLTHGSKCLLCGEFKTSFHVDHIKPRSLRPDLELDINNLQVLCKDCNIGKLNKDSVDWSKLPEKEPIFE